MIYKYNKLVRDKVPNQINSKKGKKAIYRVLSEEEYLQELNNKLIEEAHEFTEANSIEELADVMEVIISIMEQKGISLEEVREARAKKNTQRGGFKDRLFLECVEEEEISIEEQETK